MGRERSSEEEDNLQRSTKKFKDDHSMRGTYGRGPGKETEEGSFLGSYRDRLLWRKRLSRMRRRKAYVKVPWGQAIIVKTFGRNVGFLYLSSRLRSMWKPVGRMDIIDLECDFFLIKFDLKSDLDDVLKGGPWFVGQHFLAIRQWELEFNASKASCSSVAVWIRLPQLPIEFYDPSILKKIRSTIGLVLRIGSHSINGERGRFARLCIQINIDKPLIKCVKIGKMAQTVQYEGLNSLCFACGRIGHKKEGRPSLIRKPEPSPKRPGSNDQPSNSSSSGALSQEEELCNGEEHKKEQYGDWMVAKRKKRSTRGRACYPNDTLGATDRIGVTSMHSAPRDVNSDSGRDGKRKDEPVVGTGELKAVNSQPLWPKRNQASSKWNRSELASTKSGPQKPYQGKISLDCDGVFNSSRWANATWPINPPLDVNTPSEDKLPQLSLTSNSVLRVKFCDEDACKAFSENFSRQGIHSERQVILADFADTDLPDVIHSWEWESLCDASVTCPSMLIQEFYSNMHGIDRSISHFFTRVRGTRFTVTPQLVADVLWVPRVEFPNYPSCEHLRIVSKDELMIAFCERPSVWGDHQFRVIIILHHVSPLLSVSTFLFGVIV
ncbi:hypothetical protein SO802_007124 [Lithocarpus litseifolius]|uniref:DUF4283 domain-containing protein n=1 Tax=Lithocarpus litseifolius TaxID=425828 RepID=A0AAW2DSS2_9ROSI